MSTVDPDTIPPSERELAYVVPEPYRQLGIQKVADWATLDVDSVEKVPALKWPNSIVTYDRMRNDPQVDALLRGMFHPIRRFNWSIDPDGSRREVSRELAKDLGLPVIGAKKNTKDYRRNRFNHGQHLRQALLSYVYGHYPFEQIGEIEAGPRGRLMWRLRKLLPITPHSIQEIRVARDGVLEWVKQRDEYEAEKITIDRMIWFVVEREGANWFGRSLLRAAYQPWLLKDRLLRVDAIRHERNGMGVPIVELPERATDEQRKEGAALAQQYKAGLASGGAIPYGMKLRLMGVEGTTSDVLASIRYHDEAMARLMLQMFTQLGGSGNYGARNLGDTFVKFFANAQNMAADEYAETMNEHMLADWVEWNYGPNEKPPKLVYERDEDPELSAQELAQLVAQGVLSVDEELEQFLRDKYKLPALAPGTRKQVTKNNPPGTEDEETDPAFPPAPGNENLNVT